MRGAVVISCIAAIILAATALYVSFTPVAHSTILGCQKRYLLPVILPVLYFLSEWNIEVPDKIKNNVFLFGITIMGVIFLNGIYELCISLY